MYIKRLEIVGFKSFPERVLVPLSQGISAVVGPNGCGKSNIIDAIRWVMGEQSPRMLRGRSMDDVLFNGSLGRPASALAEVTLTLARDDDPANGLTAAETSVTRRLYRSGDSEYLVNKIPCRLKDVVHFFTDHGVGTRAYGIIEQGRVGWLVDARPEERRGLIDEAAGITRYKQQKKEAERKIESAEANLLNVSVIKAETKKQLDQITRAAAKAARFKALREELRELDLGLSARTLVKERGRRRELLASREANRRLLASLLAEADRHELEMENIKFAVASAERDLQEKSAVWHKLIAARDASLKELEYNRSNQVKTEERRVLALEELARISGERRRKLEEEAALKAELAGLEKADEEARRGADELRENWKARKAGFDALNRQCEEAEREAASAEREAAALAAELAGAERLLSHHYSRLEELNAELRAALEANNEAERGHEQLKAAKTALNGELAAARDEAAFQVETVLAVERKAAEAVKKAASAESALAAVSARLETLRGVKDNFGWYPTGVKALMDAPALEGLIGPLAERLRIPDGYEAAAEAALGERLAWLLVENRQAGINALDYLDKHKLGRCGFVLRDALEANGKALTQALLGDFQLAENLLDAAEASGAVLAKNGHYAGLSLVAGGQAVEDGQGDAGLLARLKEVESVERQEEDGRIELERHLAAADEASRETEFARESARAAEAAVTSLTARLAEAEKGLALAASELAQFSSRYKSLESEEGRIRKEADDLAASLGDGRMRRQAALEKAETENLKTLDLKARVRVQAEELEDLRTTGEEARAAAVQSSERLGRARHDQTRLGEWLAEVEETLASREAGVEALAREIEDYAARVDFLDQQAGSFPAKIEEADKALAETREKLETERKRQDLREKEAREVRRRREDLNSILAGQETELISTNFTLEKVEEDLRRDWKIIMPDKHDLDECRPQEEPVEAGSDESAAEPEQAADNYSSEQEAAEVDSEKPEPGEEEPAQLEPSFELIDPEQWAVVELPPDAARRRDELKNKIGSLGEVSLGAIEKEAELRHEYDRYQSQYDDLTKAIADLKDSINKINYTCKIRFAETFKAVDEKFREIFPILFEGGEGWISLTDEEDPLESGVEIHVHPPGKKVLVMSLLSGGEKALTALALIFALYLIKPSPFCLLDETDAPLDEANIDRFNRLLRQLSRASQIIMVTHNKRTMQISHTLYGVTMETPGVSKLVSVNLAEAEALTTDV